MTQSYLPDCHQKKQILRETPNTESSYELTQVSVLQV